MERPYQEINEIITSVINAINLSSEIQSYSAYQNGNFLLDGDDVIIILEGRFEICNKENGLLLGAINGPYIINITSVVFDNNYFFTNKCCFSYLTCSRKDFYTHIETHDLWRSLFSVLNYSSWLLYQQLEVMKMSSLYDVVKYYLVKIENDSELVRKENICQYITSRTGYSRSGVMTIIRELKKGGYIDIENGKLLWIKSLPLKF